MDSFRPCDITRAESVWCLGADPALMQPSGCEWMFVLDGAGLRPRSRGLTCAAGASLVREGGEDVNVHFVELQDRKRANLARFAKHDAYLVREEADGTLIWEPATVITEAERRLMQDEVLMAQITEARSNPAPLRRRDRSGAERSD